MDPETPYPVIDLLPEQKEIEDLGGTMRLGAQAVELADGTRALASYNELVVHERHRHRYEVNNHFRPQLVEAGLVVSGTFQEGRLVEIVELPDHPWFVASQFHPEFKSRPDAAGAALPRLRRRRLRASARALRRSPYGLELTGAVTTKEVNAWSHEWHFSKCRPIASMTWSRWCATSSMPLFASKTATSATSCSATATSGRVIGITLWENEAARGQSDPKAAQLRPEVEQATGGAMRAVEGYEVLYDVRHQ